MKGEWRCAPRGGVHRPLLQDDGMSFNSRPARVFTTGVRTQGSLQIHGTVRCRVRTEQNFAPTRSTAASATVQPLSS